MVHFMGLTGKIGKGLAATGAVAAGTVIARRWVADGKPSRIAAVVTIRRPRAEVWSFLRDPNNHAAVVPGLRLSAAGERWHARFQPPGDLPEIEWEIETLQEVETERLVLSSVPGSEFDATAVTRLEDAPGGGSELRVEFEIHPPERAVAAAARGLEPVTERALEQVLRRVKHLLEAGEIPTTDGQPAGAGRSEERPASGDR
jgi:uncharacterized membrane protein